MNIPIVALCFLPLAVVFVIIKLALLTSSTSEEITYVAQEAKKPHGPYVANPYEDVDEEDEKD